MFFAENNTHYPGFDSDIKRFVSQQMQENGVHFHAETQIKEIQKNAGENLTLLLSSGGHELTEVSQVLFATGRSPNTKKSF